MHINRVFFSGRLTRDPDVQKTGPSRAFPDGTPVCNVSLAQNSRKKEGDRWVDGDPIYVDVTFWGNRAESFSKFHKKGDETYIEGRLRFDTWEDQSGGKRTRLKVDADEWQFVPRGKATEEAAF